MATENLILDEKRKAQLDENLKAMSENGVDNESIIAYANDFKSKYGSPKPTAPSMQGGESGAVKTPSTSTSVLEDLESDLWTKQISGQQPKPTPYQPLVKPAVKEEPKIAGTITTPVLKIAGLEEPKVIPKSYAPTVQENIAKIEGMTLKTKFPEYAKPTETFDFKKASAQAVSEEEKARQQERVQRSEQRRLDNLPKEIDKLKAERNDLMLDKSVEGRKKLAANEAVTRNFEKELEDSKKSEYKSLEKLNQGAVKGLGKEVFEYLQENPKLNDKVQSVGLNDKETYNLIQNAVQNKIAPLQQDLETFQKEGTVALAAGKINASNLIQSKQNELQGIADELNSYQNNYLKKNGFSAITEQYNQAKKKLDSYTPTIQKINKESEYYKKELNTIKEKIDSYSSKIQGNNFNGTQAELNDYNSLIKEYNETLNDLNSYPDLFKEELSGYENAVSNYNSILAKRNSIAQGLKDTEYNKLSSRYEAARLEYDSMLEQYKKYEEPAVKDRINKYFSTVSQIGEYDNKLKTAKGAMPSIEELEKAKKAFDQTGLGGDLLDIGGRAVNSILDASAKLVASPFRLASSFSDFAGRDNVYHYSEYIADLIEGTDREPVFMTKESNNFYDAQKDKINWGVVPVVAGVADQLGILLTLAVTGKYVTPAVEGFMTTAGMDLAAAAEISESAKIASTIAPAFLISYGDNYKEAIDKGFSSKGAIAYSGALSLLEGITEMIIPDKELLFGKDGKSILLNRFIKDYAKGKKYAVKRLAEGFLYNAFGEATEENIAAIGKTFATTIGHAIDKDIQIDIPTINQTITTSVTSGLTGGGMGIIGQVSEETNMYKMGVAELAKNFQSGKDLLTALKDKGKIEEKRYDKLITDAQKYQAVAGKIPKGLSQFKTIAIAEKMIAINELYSQMDKDEKNPINKINKKKINAIQDEIAGIIDDKEFDSKFQDQLNKEADGINEQSQPDIALQKYTGATPEKYGYIDRGDGKGKVELTKEEFLKEYYNLYPDLKPTELEEGISALGEGATETPEPKKILSIAEISNIMAEKKKAAEFLEEMKRKAAEARKRGEEVAFRKEQEAAAFLEEQRKKRDAEVEELKLIRPDLTDDDMLLIDLPDSVDKALDRLEANIPTDMVQVNEAIEALDKKFEQLQAYKNDPKRTHTIEQIDEVVDMLSEAKSKLQFYQLEIENHESRQQQQKSSEGKSETEVSETGAVAEKAETQPTTTEQVEEKPKPTEKPKTKEEIAAEIERLKNEKEEKLRNIGQKQKQAVFQQLRESKTPEEKLNAINLIERNVAEGATLTKEEQREIQKIKDELASEGYVVYDLLGNSLNQGMRARPVSTIPDATNTLAAGEEVITKILKPQINKDDKMVQSAEIEVTVGTKEGGLTRKQWLEQQKKQTSKNKIAEKYDSQITELEKQYEQETKKENGEPMPTGVQGVRTEGEGGQESTELRPSTEKEKVADPLKDVESTAKALEGVEKTNKSENKNTDIAYHGTPYNYDEFDVSKIGTGEGAAKRGIGIYFMRRKRLAPFFANINSEDAPIHIGKGKSKADKSKINPRILEVSGFNNLKLKKGFSRDISNWAKRQQDFVKQGFDGFETEDGEITVFPESIGKIKIENKNTIGEFIGKNSDIDFREWTTEKGKESQVISEAYHKAKADGSNPQLVEAVEKLLKPTQEKVSGGLTQEEKTNLENIAKEAGVNFQEVRNVYNKYGEGKPLSEITLEDYQKAQEKRDKGKEAKTEEGAPTITVEEEKPKPQLPKTRKERLDSLREKAKKLKGAKPVSSAVGAVMTKAREALNWIKQKAGVKETKISERNPLLTEAAKRLKNGEITNEEYRAILNENSPIAPITTFFDPATGQQVENSVDASKRKNANKPVASGTRVGLRIDIPAFRNNNIWVVSVHDGLKKAGEILSYKNAARITNVVFGTQSPKASLEIAAGGQKTAMVGRIFGDWNDLEGKTEDEKGETAKKLVEEIVNDPSWVQVGMNPFRQSYFYDRSSQLGRPVLSADEVVQIGGLVYAKNVKYGNWTDEAFRVKGLLDKAGKPVQFSKGKRMSDVENFISSSIEEGYPLDEVSEIVQEMWGKSEAEANKLIDKYKPTKTTKNAVQEPSTKREVSPTGEGRKDITEGGEGVGQGKQGEKATQEGVQEKIDALVNKSLPASERRKIMQENPLIKRIFDNIKELHKQLEEKGLITKEGNCP